MYRRKSNNSKVMNEVSMNNEVVRMVIEKVLRPEADMEHETGTESEELDRGGDRRKIERRLE